MALIPDFVRGSRAFFLLVFLACAGALSFALIGEHLLGLAPCVLCIAERYPLAAAGVIAGAMAALPSSPGLRRIALVLMVLAFAGNAVLAGYHVGVEQDWWDSPACAGEAPTAISLQDLRAAASEPARPPCDQPQWMMFGISLAGYNMLLNLALAAVVAVALGREIRRSRR